MNTECNQQSFSFYQAGRREVVARFDGGFVSSDGGGVLLREVEKQTRIVEQFASCFTDHRDPNRIEHALTHLVGQRVFGLALGYPTLLELAGLAQDEKCDGKSIVPLLRDPKAKWDRPAIMAYLRGNHAVRSDRWRYIRYADGSEELYDHENDGNEWNNLAADSSYADVMARHRKWLPKAEAKPVRDLRRKPSK